MIGWNAVSRMAVDRAGNRPEGRGKRAARVALRRGLIVLPGDRRAIASSHAPRALPRPSSGSMPGTAHSVESTRAPSGRAARDARSEGPDPCRIERLLRPTCPTRAPRGAIYLPLDAFSYAFFFSGIALVKRSSSFLIGGSTSALNL